MSPISLLCFDSGSPGPVAKSVRKYTCGLRPLRQFFRYQISRLLKKEELLTRSNIAIDRLDPFSRKIDLLVPDGLGVIRVYHPLLPLELRERDRPQHQTIGARNKRGTESQKCQGVLPSAKKSHVRLPCVTTECNNGHNGNILKDPRLLY